jgi:multidrug efflux pump subunit AcrA (membrane-fusion protein)
MPREKCYRSATVKPGDEAYLYQRYAVKSLPKIYLRLKPDLYFRFSFGVSHSKERKMEKRTRMKITAAVLGTAVVAGAFMFGPNLLVVGAGDAAGAESRETPLFSVKTENAARRTLRAFLEVNGDIVSAQEAEVFPNVPGKLVRVNVALGSEVRKGDLIAEVDPSKPGAAYRNSPVLAPISGTVSRAPLPVGTTVGAGTGIAAISVVDKLEITARIPEREVAELTNGLSAEISLPAFPGEIFGAAVVRVSPVLDSASRTKLISLTFDGNDSRASAGMFARVRINTRTYAGALTVPAEAVVRKRGETCVYVVRNNGAALYGAEKRVVEAGVSLNGWTEIKSGLAEGEAVVVQGQQLLSGGEAVRVIAGAR